MVNVYILIDTYVRTTDIADINIFILKNRAKEVEDFDLNVDWYMATYTRTQPYLFGLLTGYILWQLKGKELKMHWVLLKNAKQYRFLMLYLTRCWQSLVGLLQFH